jgi:hypothetical protein
MTAQNSALDYVNKSGFPLQIALAHEVRASTMRHSWRVMYEEHAWRSGDGSGFVDIVLENAALSAVLLIECKRLHDTRCVFLPPYNSADPLGGRAKAYVARREGGSMRRGYPAWIDTQLILRPPEVAYCVVGKNVGKSNERTIEPIAAELVAAAEAVEHEERQFYLDLSPPERRCYFTAIVTTAQLEVCSFDPAKISLADGTIPAGAAVEPANVVRFRKQLSFQPPVNHTPTVSFPNEAARLASEKERTVFVIRAKYLTEFLVSFRLPPSLPDRP